MLTPVQAQGVSFELPNGRSLFNNLSFTLSHRITALVGPNGIGKSCLAKILAGEIEPTSGQVRGSAVYFPQKETPPEISVEEYLLEVAWSFLGQNLCEGILKTTLCSQLSGGEWMRVRLAKVLDQGFLILDEPTNDLDRDARQGLLDFLTHYSQGIFLISHDRECLALAGEVLELSQQGLSKYGAGWAEYEEEKKRERGALADNLEKAKRYREQVQRERTEKIAKQEKRNRRGQKLADSGGIPRIAAGNLKRWAQKTSGKIDADATARSNDAVREAFEAFQSLKVDSVMYADLHGVALPAQKLIAEAKGYNIKFSDWLFPEDINLVWRGNIRLALKGGNGSGKSTLLKAINGEDYLTRGELRRGELKTLYIDQRCALLDESKSAFENVRDSASLDESEIRNGLAKFLFTKDAVFQKASTLSGGERLRATLAKGLMSNEKPELLILDEPTNNLDLANVEFLEALVRAFRGAVIVVSHDEVFLENCGLLSELKLGGK